MFLVHLLLILKPTFPRSDSYEIPYGATSSQTNYDFLLVFSSQANYDLLLVFFSSANYDFWYWFSKSTLKKGCFIVQLYFYWGVE